MYNKLALRWEQIGKKQYTVESYIKHLVSDTDVCVHFLVKLILLTHASLIRYNCHETACIIGESNNSGPPCLAG